MPSDPSIPDLDRTGEDLLERCRELSKGYEVWRYGQRPFLAACVREMERTRQEASELRERLNRAELNCRSALAYFGETGETDQPAFALAVLATWIKAEYDCLRNTIDSDAAWVNRAYQVCRGEQP